MMNLFQDILSSLFERKSPAGAASDSRPLNVLCNEMLTGKGEVSGYRIAQAILDRIDSLDDDGINDFFLFLANEYDIDDDAIAKASDTYRKTRSAENLAQIFEAAEPKRQEILRRLNQFSGATARLVKLREKLLVMAKSDANLQRVDLDFQRLFRSWFNRGFLVLRRIDWETPASILEKIIEYEAVHEIDDWDDLRRRLQPEDRRCYGFFHPSMPNDPLIFVEVALSRAPPNSIQDILSPEREITSPAVADTAVFYSISNCQYGLQGISFGNFLIKQVVQELRSEMPNFQRFITLSPLPKFRSWLEKRGQGKQDPKEQDVGQLRQQAAKYLVEAKTASGTPFDPVARFHLNNGALIEDVHAKADLSDKGLSQSFGVMVNYLYDLKKIEKNHEAYATQQKIIISSDIKRLLADAKSGKKSGKK